MVKVVKKNIKEPLKKKIRVMGIKVTKKKKDVGTKKKVLKKSMKKKNLIETQSNLISSHENDSDDNKIVPTADQEEYLRSLKNSDPEFYRALMKSNRIDMVDEDIKEEDENEQKEEVKGFNKVISLELIDNWKQHLESGKITIVFRNVNQALKAALINIGASENEVGASYFIVKEPEIFNAIVRLCIGPLSNSLQTTFKKSVNPTKTKHWNVLHVKIKQYLKNITILLSYLAEETAVEAVLKQGILPVLHLFAVVPVLTKEITREFIKIWSTNHERARVLAFVGIFRLFKSFNYVKKEKLLKSLYLTYVKNSHFTSTSTWPLIDFMRVSLIELYKFEEGIAYKHAFVYTRQMALHLRNAIKGASQEKLKLVYNWQYVHCLHLWADLLCQACKSQELRPLLYPLVQVCLGTLRLQPSAAYYPLLFHVGNILTNICRHTFTFIPILPYLLEPLKHKSLLLAPSSAPSGKGPDWLCILKLSSSQLSDASFSSSLFEHLYGAVLNYLSAHAASISFPELAIFAINKMKDFVKNGKNPSRTKPMKNLLDMIKENSEFIENKRKTVTFELDDHNAVKNWEIEIGQLVPPLESFYVKWKSSLQKDVLHSLAAKGGVETLTLPMVRRRELLQRQLEQGKAQGEQSLNEFKKFFEDDNDNGNKLFVKSKRKHEDGESENETEEVSEEKKQKINDKGVGLSDLFEDSSENEYDFEGLEDEFSDDEEQDEEEEELENKRLQKKKMNVKPQNSKDKNAKKKKEKELSCTAKFNKEKNKPDSPIKQKNKKATDKTNAKNKKQKKEKAKNKKNSRKSYNLVSADTTIDLDSSMVSIKTEDDGIKEEDDWEDLSPMPRFDHQLSTKTEEDSESEGNLSDFFE